MKKITVAILLLSITIFSCRMLLSKKYGTNKPFNFKSKEAYFNYLKDSKHFEREHLVYIDSINFFNIFHELGQPYSVYKGSFLNDSTSIKKSDQLMSNEACMGRMDGEIQKNIVRKQFVDSFLGRSTFLRSFNFMNANLQPIKFDNNNRLKVVLMYSYAQGSVYDYIYEEVYKTYNKSDKSFDLYIISFDQVYKLPD